MSRTRTFIGIDTGDAIRASATALQKELAKTGAEVKWATPESMHVTLLFLGEVDDRELHAVCKAVQEVAAGEPPFPFACLVWERFPLRGARRSCGPGSPMGAGSLQRLNAALEERMLALGCYRKEERGYTPHLTLGRVKGDSDSFAAWRRRF